MKKEPKPKPARPPKKPKFLVPDEDPADTAMDTWPPLTSFGKAATA